MYDVIPKGLMVKHALFNSMSGQLSQYTYN